MRILYNYCIHYYKTSMNYLSKSLVSLNILLVLRLATFHYTSKQIVISNIFNIGVSLHHRLSTFQL